jgi:hypothetical protein
MQPLGLPPAEATTISFVGTALADQPMLWTGFPTAEPPELVVKADAKPDPARAQFRIKPASSVGPGIYGLRIFTRGGASNLRLIMVDDLPRIAEATTNKSPEKAMKLKPPAAIDAVYEAETFDYYTFSAKAKQRLSIEIVARRLGSTMDPVLRLLDAEGRELAFADDDETAGADPRLAHVFAAAGNYTIEIRDVRYQGNASARYRLRIGEFPLLTAPYPAAVQKGTTAEVEATGVGLGDMPPVEVKVPADSKEPARPITFAYGKGKGSATATEIVSNEPEQLEAEPNDSPDHATPLNLLGAMNGRFAVPRDRDFFRFQAKKGDTVRFVGRTRSLGSPTDLYLQILTADGKKQLAETDDAGLDEGTLELKVADDGEYLLAVEDLIGRGGPTYTYRLEIDLNRPRLTASIDADKYDVPPAGIAQAKTNIVRSGFDGPVKFRLQATDDAKLDDVQLVGSAAAGKSDIILTMFVPPTHTAGKPLNVRLFAEATVDGKTISTPVRTIAGLRKSLAGQPNPPASLDGIVALGLGPATASFALSTKTPTVPFAKEGKAEVVVAVDRMKLKDAIVDLNAYGLPEGFAAKQVTIEKGKDEATLVVTGPKDAKPLTQPFYIVGTTVVTKKSYQASLAGLTLAAGGAKEPVAKEQGAPSAKSQATGAAEKAKPTVSKGKPDAKPQATGPAAKPKETAKAKTTDAKVRKPTQVEP